ncbi:MAG: hypothetical protein R3178_04465, partial [Rhodothermales bacterium]|nr:hypothetical protein [Rhodothermales bacterium]
LGANQQARNDNRGESTSSLSRPGGIDKLGMTGGRFGTLGMTHGGESAGSLWPLGQIRTLGMTHGGESACIPLSSIDCHPR